MTVKVKKGQTVEALSPPKKLSQLLESPELAAEEAMEMAHIVQVPPFPNPKTVTTTTKSPVKATSTVEFAHGKGVNKVTTKKQEQEEVPVGLLPTANAARVGLSAGFTIGLPNYSSARADVTLEIPCSTQDVEKTYTFCKNWVDNKLTLLRAEIEEGGE